jgi:hypothetical protein
VRVVRKQQVVMLCGQVKLQTDVIIQAEFGGYGEVWASLQIRGVGDTIWTQRNEMTGTGTEPKLLLVTHTKL